MIHQSHSWAYNQTKLYSEKTHEPQLFIITLFTLAKTWKQPQCSSTVEWIKMRCIYTVGYYSAIKKDEIISFSATWLQLEIILSEIRKNTISLIRGIWNMTETNLSTKQKHKDPENRLVAAMGGAGCGREGFHISASSYSNFTEYGSFSAKAILLKTYKSIALWIITHL